MILQPPFSPTAGRRPGMVLLIVITMLTLFAITGIAFVTYAESEATASGSAREAVDLRVPDIDPEAAMGFFLGKLIYDERDDTGGAYSALRGHSLLRTVYGMDYDFDTTVSPPQMIMHCRSAPFSGTGRLHYSLTAAMGAGALTGIDDYEAINYTFFQGLGGPLRDPERIGFRANLASALSTQTFGVNVPYTYPDLHNFFLAAIRSDGTVLTPSFHREYLFGSLAQQATAASNWLNTSGKYKTLRPRPVDNAGINGNPGFPYPEDRGGDVRNLPFGLGAYGVGGNDSLWIDLDAPIMTAPDGRRYKMLFAPLIIDLDNRINLNIAGSMLARSNQGWGRWEMNLTRLGTVPTEFNNVFQGNNALPQVGLYGLNNTAPHGTAPTPAPSAPGMHRWTSSAAAPRPCCRPPASSSPSRPSRATTTPRSCQPTTPRTSASSPR